MNKPSDKTLTIPQIRARLYILAQEHALPELQWLAEETKRRFNGRRAPIRSRHVDDDLRIRIQAYAAANPKASQQAIAEHFSTNAGRVSEALFGKRGEE